MRDIVLDFESYFDKDVTLKKLSISDYVSHAKFAVLGLGAWFLDETEARWVSAPEVEDFLSAIDWDDTRVIAHNALFDGYVLHLRYNRHPRRYACTQALADFFFQGGVSSSLKSVAKAVGAPAKLDMPHFKGKYWADLNANERIQLAEYGIADAIACGHVAKALLPALPEKEQALMDLTIGLFCKPVLQVDTALAQQGLDEAREERRRILKASGQTIETLRANEPFAELLRARDVEIPTKLSPTTGQAIYAFAKTDEAFTELLQHEDEVVRNLVRARLSVKSTLEITRAERLLKMATSGDHRLAIALNYAKAHTHRWTGANKMNPQNLTSGSTLRRSIQAPEGYLLDVRDSAQIEARSLAWVAKEEWKLIAYRQGRDTYSELATELFGFPVSKKTPDERFIGKTADLGLGFTMWWPKFIKTVAVQSELRLGKRITLDREFAAKTVLTWRRKHQKIVEAWMEADRILTHLAVGQDRITAFGGLIEVDCKEKRLWFPNGTSLYYPRFENSEEGFRYLVQLKTGRFIHKYVHKGLLIENIIQKFARDVIGEQMLRINERYRVVMMTHDEIVSLIPENEIEEGSAWTQEQLLIPPAWAHDLPLAAEGGYDRCYSK